MRKMTWLAGLALGLTLTAGGAEALAADTSSGSVIHTGVYIDGIDVSGMTETEARAEVEDYVEEMGTETLTLNIGDNQIQTTLGDLGLSCTNMDVVEEAIRIQESYKLANRKFHPKDTVVDVAGVKFGDGSFQIIAGPCCIESESQVCEIAEEIKASGASILRGGAYKPRTSPYSFQGMGEEGLKLLIEAKKLTGLPVVTEVLDISQLELFKDVDMIQVGARNMQNYELLKELGEMDKPVLLKRGSACTIEELLMSAEYILKGGNENVILCERGIRTFETATRNTLDISAIPVLKKKTHLPVIVDPSHGTGNASLVPPMALAAAAAGADGLMVEVHSMPEYALCDGPQAIKPEDFEKLVEMIEKLRPFAYDYKR